MAVGLYKGVEWPALDCFTLFVPASCDSMELAVSGGSSRAAQRRATRASRGLSRRLGMRMLLHGNLLRCSLLGSLPASWPQRYQPRPSFLSASHHSPASPSTAAIKDHQPCSTTAPHHQQQQQTTTTTLQPWAADGSCRPPRAPGMTITPRGPSATASNSSLSHCSSSGSVEPRCSPSPPHHPSAPLQGSPDLQESRDLHR